MTLNVSELQRSRKFVEAEVVASDHPCGVLQCDTCGAVLGVIGPSCFRDQDCRSPEGAAAMTLRVGRHPARKVRRREVKPLAPCRDPCVEAPPKGASGSTRCATVRLGSGCRNVRAGSPAGGGRWEPVWRASQS